MGRAAAIGDHPGLVGLDRLAAQVAGLRRLVHPATIRAGSRGSAVVGCRRSPGLDGKVSQAERQPAPKKCARTLPRLPLLGDCREPGRIRFTRELPHPIVVDLPRRVVVHRSCLLWRMGSDLDRELVDLGRRVARACVHAHDRLARGPVARQNTLPRSGSSQARSKWTLSSTSMARSRSCASFSCSAVTPMKPEWTSMNLAIENLSGVLSLEVRREDSGRHRVDDRWAPSSIDACPGRSVAATREPIGHSTDARGWRTSRRLRPMSSAGPVQCPILVGRDDLP